MTWNARWFVLPLGVAGPGELALALVAGPQGDDGEAGRPPVPCRLVSDDGAIDLPVTVRSPHDDAWQRMTATAMARRPAPAPCGQLVVDAVTELAAIERSIARAAPTRTLLARERATLGPLGETITTLRRGRTPTGALADLADTEPPVMADASMRIDLTVPAFQGEHSVRVVSRDGLPMDGSVEQPWTRVVCDGQHFELVASPQAGGMLAVANVDVRQAARRVVDLASDLAAGAEDAPVRMPTLPDAGITVVAVGPSAVRHGQVLYAEDVAAGLLVEVSTDGVAFVPAFGRGSMPGEVVRWAGDAGPPLRFGQRYWLRVQATDASDRPIAQPQVVDAGRYLRRQSVDPPSISGGTGVGESVEWTVGGAHEAIELELSPPLVDPAVAERHGVLTSQRPAGSVQDPAAAGVSLIGLPGHPPSVVIPFPGAWPERMALQLVVRAAADDEIVEPGAIVVEHEPGGRLVELLVARGVDTTFEMASPVADDMLCHLHVGDLPPAALLRGTATLRSRRTSVRVVHAAPAGCAPSRSGQAETEPVPARECTGARS